MNALCVLARFGFRSRDADLIRWIEPHRCFNCSCYRICFYRFVRFVLGFKGGDWTIVCEQFDNYWERGMRFVGQICL